MDQQRLKTYSGFFGWRGCLSQLTTRLAFWNLAAVGEYFFSFYRLCKLLGVRRVRFWMGMLGSFADAGEGDVLNET